MAANDTKSLNERVKELVAQKCKDKNYSIRWEDAYKEVFEENPSIAEELCRAARKVKEK